MKVLIIEDITINIKLLENLMKKYAKCDSTLNGEAGLKALKFALNTKNNYDLICLDINLPGMCGFEVLREIRKIDTGPEKVKILMTTSAADKESVMKAIHFGCDGYLIKPYTKQNLEKQLIKLNLYDPEVEVREQEERETKDKAVQTNANEQPEQESKEKTQ